MNETSQLDEERVLLVQEHDALLAALPLSNSERRRLGVRLSGAQLRKRLHAVGLAIAQSGQPVYPSAKEFLDANP